MKVPKWTRDFTVERAVEVLNGDPALASDRPLNEAWNDLPLPQRAIMWEQYQQYHELTPRNEADCVIWAICLATGIAYENVMRATGRVEQWFGYKPAEIQKILRWLDVPATFYSPGEVTDALGLGVQLGAFAERMDEGPWLVMVPGHMVCVHRGLWNDSTEPDWPVLCCFKL